MNDKLILKALKVIIERQTNRGEEYPEVCQEIESYVNKKVKSSKEINKELTEDLFSEDIKECSCGHKVDKGSEGCGKVIEEWVQRCSNEEIVDTGWHHCGENNMLCDECKDALSEGEDK